MSVRSHSPEEGDERKSKKPRTSTACNLCRQRRAKCDGMKPSCTACVARGAQCDYDLGGDKRKPFTKSVVAAMQLRIDTLEAQLAALTNQTGIAPPLAASLLNPSDPTTATPRPANPAEPSLTPRAVPLDAFQGGLALNAHNELRFYGPTSSYRSVVAEAVSSSSANTNAIRSFSLTRAPIPTAAPAEPSLPRRPPELTPDFQARLFRLAFEYCFSTYNLVPERAFYEDLQMRPFERTHHYSPFLRNLVLAVGCRYLDPNEPFPPEICGLIGDPDTRGDVFVTWSRYLLDQEWYNPKLSTIRGLILLTLYLAGRGFDGPASMFNALSMKLTEDFGLHLGIHRLTIGHGGISEDLLTARRDTFWSAFASDVIAALYIGRNIAIDPLEVDTIPSPIVAADEYEAPMYRSSAFNWSARLLLLGARILTTVYSLRPNIALATRQAAVPELHLALETWYHELPGHLRASGTDPKTAPHAHIIALNLTYHNMHVLLHRPFFRRHVPTDPSGAAGGAAGHANISTDKCLVAAAHIVRLVKLLKNSSGLRLGPNGVQHAAFCAGTILAISAVEDGISDTVKQDQDRRAGARRDLRFLVEALKEIGQTWTTSATSAAVLESLMMTWGSDPTPPPATNSTDGGYHSSTQPYAPTPVLRHQPERSHSLSGSQHTASPDLSVSEHGSELYATPDVSTVPLPGPMPSGLVGGGVPSAWPAGDRAGLLNRAPQPHAPKHGLADGSDPFTFIFPSWALDSGETSGFISMLNPVLNPEGQAQGVSTSVEATNGHGHEHVNGEGNGAAQVA